MIFYIRKVIFNFEGGFIKFDFIGFFCNEGYKEFKVEYK